MLSPLDYTRVPELGFGNVLDAVRHLMCFALDLLERKIEDVDAEYINSLAWYRALPEVLAGSADDEGEAKRHRGI